MLRKIIPASIKHRMAATLQSAYHTNMIITKRGKDSTTKLKNYYNKYKGKTCIILGNGPSLKSLDLSTLTNHVTFCLNRGYLLWKDQPYNPTFYIAVNDLVIEQFSQEISQLECPIFLPWRHRAHFTEGREPIFIRVRWDHKFQTHATHGIWPGATVTVAALQIAYHMGFNKVVLLGIDHKFADAGVPHSQIIQNGEDLNHFHPDYFSRGTIWNLPDLKQSERSYELAKLAYSADNRIIVNATPGSALDIFPKQPLPEALQE